MATATHQLGVPTPSVWHGSVKHSVGSWLYSCTIFMANVMGAFFEPSRHEQHGLGTQQQVPERLLWGRTSIICGPCHGTAAAYGGLPPGLESAGTIYHIPRPWSLAKRLSACTQDSWQLKAQAGSLNESDGDGTSWVTPWGKSLMSSICVLTAGPEGFRIYLYSKPTQTSLPCRLLFLRKQRPDKPEAAMSFTISNLQLESHHDHDLFGQVSLCAACDTAAAA